MTWEAAVAAFGEHLAGTDRSPATIEAYRKHVGWLASTAPAGPWELTPLELARWLDEKGWSRETRRKVVVSLRVFYAWAVRERLCEWAPTAGLPASQAPRKRGPVGRAIPPAWEPDVEAFLSWGRAGGRHESTLEVRMFYLRRLAEVLADPWSVSAEQLGQWLSNPDWSPETKRAARSTVRTFYRWGVMAGRIERSPAEFLDTVLTPRALPRPVPHDVLREALAAADDRTRLMMLLAAYAGLRRAEIARLHTSQVSDTELLVVGKGGHHRRVPVHPELRSALAVELERRRRGTHGSGWSGPFVTEHGYVFPSDLSPDPLTASHVGVLVSEALPDGWTCHTLRHWFATGTYAEKRDLRTVQELLGHAKPETTAIYAAVPDGAKQDAVMALSLRRW